MKVVLSTKLKRVPSNKHHIYIYIYVSTRTIHTYIYIYMYANPLPPGPTLHRICIYMYTYMVVYISVRILLNLCRRAYPGFSRPNRDGFCVQAAGAGLRRRGFERLAATPGFVWFNRKAKRKTAIKQGAH